MSYEPKQYICTECLEECDYIPYRCNGCGKQGTYKLLDKIATLPLTKADKHQKLCEGLNEIYRKKSQDYGDSFGQQFEEYGEISAAIRLDDKLKRFKQLIKQPAQVKDESKIDTLIDLANYALMTVIELEGSKSE